MAVTTTVLLLTCIGAMLWLRMRKQAAARLAPDAKILEAGNASVTTESTVEVPTED